MSLLLLSLMVALKLATASSKVSCRDMMSSTCFRALAKSFLASDVIMSVSLSLV